MNGALLYKIYETAARQTLNIVNLQYLNYKVTDQITHKQANISKKGLTELFHNIQEDFLAYVEKKEWKQLQQNGQVIHFEPGEQIFRKGTRAECVAMMLSGELMTF